MNIQDKKYIYVLLAASILFMHWQFVNLARFKADVNKVLRQAKGIKLPDDTLTKEAYSLYLRISDLDQQFDIQHHALDKILYKIGLAKKGSLLIPEEGGFLESGYLVKRMKYDAAYWRGKNELKIGAQGKESYYGIIEFKDLFSQLPENAEVISAHLSLRAKPEERKSKRLVFKRFSTIPFDLFEVIDDGIAGIEQKSSKINVNQCGVIYDKGTANQLKDCIWGDISARIDRKLARGQWVINPYNDQQMVRFYFNQAGLHYLNENIKKKKNDGSWLISFANPVDNFSLSFYSEDAGQKLWPQLNITYVVFEESLR